MMKYYQMFQKIKTEFAIFVKFNFNFILKKLNVNIYIFQGNCYCSRCLRNDMIIRLKSMYIFTGGELNKI